VGVADSLREQQELSDQAFRLQDRFQPQRDDGQQPGQNRANRSARRRTGTSRANRGSKPVRTTAKANREQGKGSIADRQQALRDELRRKRRSAGDGTRSDAASDALDRAVVPRRREALRRDDLAEAIDNQSAGNEACRGDARLAKAMDQTAGVRTGQAQPSNAVPRNQDPRP